MRPDDAKILIPSAHVEQSERDFPEGYDSASLQVFHAVRALAQRMNDRATEWLSEFGLSASKFNYLAVLYARRETGLSPNEIGALVHTASGTVTSMLDALEREKLALRRRHPTDGRSSVIKLTRKGEQLFVRAARVHHDQVTGALDGLSAGEQAALVASLVRIGNALIAEREGHRRGA